jgi:hypothetical protein
MKWVWKKHGLLLCMFLSYLIPIAIVASYALQESSPTVSHILCKTENNTMILLAMMLMGFFTVWYESLREDSFSLVIISCLLVSIFGLLVFHETENRVFCFETVLHKIFALGAFFSIFFFMLLHAWLVKDSWVLWFFVMVQIGCLLYWMFDKESAAVFLVEAVFIGVFALFYFYLHGLQNVSYKIISP